MEYANRSRRREPNCSTFRLIRPTSTPSRRLGPNSNNCSVPPRPEPKRPSTKPSRNCCRRSHQTTPRHGSDSASALYSNRENALGFKATQEFVAYISKDLTPTYIDEGAILIADPDH